MVRGKGNEAVHAVRLSDDLVERLDAIAEKMKADPRQAAVGQVTRASAHRAALVEGIEVLEERYGLTRRSPSKR